MVQRRPTTIIQTDHRKLVRQLKEAYTFRMSLAPHYVLSTIFSIPKICTSIYVSHGLATIVIALEGEVRGCCPADGWYIAIIGETAN